MFTSIANPHQGDNKKVELDEEDEPYELDKLKDELDEIYELDN